ncbi:MAG: hypothetical protein ABL927_00900 [Bdellovibrionales bacterium]
MKQTKSALKNKPLNISSRLKPTSLEMANQMYKDAFQVKKQGFAAKNPNLSDGELDIMTKQYLAEINK